MATQSDLLIPFWPAASWIYLSATPVMLLSLFVLSERSDVRALSVAVALEIAIAGLIYAFMPVEPTPRIDGDISSVFAFADRLNLTYNSFPSLHVALCTTGAVAMMAQGKTLRNAMLLLWALAVSGSTLVTHQHTIADVAGGVVLAGLGLIAFCVLRTVLPRSPKAA
jgi:membrane-associated phospholipid phosphatase